MEKDDRPHGSILCFDYGKRRIGVAVGQTITGTATSLAVVSNGDKPDWSEISRHVTEWKPSGFVVGLPLSVDGEETRMSARARAFGNKLSGRYGISVCYQDERLTSVDAQREFAVLRAAGGAKRKDAGRLDAVAAKIILENWLQNQ
ncbi:MAG TPA: Holliday junction resolvase RuvX [Xanthomonadales bacterium]|nr:Holliday junction resolvase RuvX [Xanthomonadales bacterium]